MLAWVLAGVAMSAAAGTATPVIAGVRGADGMRQDKQDILAQSARQAVARLARKGGFSADPRLRIGMPPTLREAEKLLRRLGAKKETEAFILAMNETAEALAARAEPLLLSAIREADTTAWPGGSDSPLTDGLRRSHEAALRMQMVPMARQMIQGELIERVYRRVVKQATRFGYLHGTAPPLEQYLAEQTLNGVFAAMAEVEKNRYPSEAIPSARQPRQGANGTSGPVPDHATKASPMTVDRGN